MHYLAASDITLFWVLEKVSQFQFSRNAVGLIRMRGQHHRWLLRGSGGDGAVCDICVVCRLLACGVSCSGPHVQAEEREAKLASKAAEKDAKAAAKRAAKAEKRSEIAALREDPSRAKRLRGRAAAARLEIDNRR
jgi:hypothetical protein